MNKKIDIRWWAVLLVLGCAMSGYAASFGTGTNAFNLTFQDISSASNPSTEHNYGQVAYDYGIGTYEITADQWSKYVTSSGGPVGDGNASPTTSGNQAANFTSWYDAAQFVNWLNTDSGYAPAYNFDDEGDMSLWGDGEQSATSAFRHKDAIYVLPSEDEWMKAAYWNGSAMQLYATPNGEMPTMTEANYGHSDDPDGGVWGVGGGSVELNGTYDMMGNVVEWLEGPYSGDLFRISGGSYDSSDEEVLQLGSISWATPGSNRTSFVGFRVAAVPEPASLVLIGLFGGGVLLIRRIFMM